MIKARAIKHVLVDGKRYKPGAVFETDAETFAVLAEYGHAEEIKEPKNKKRAAK